jgi:prevent-host-death family protein
MPPSRIIIAIISSYNITMDVSIAAAKNRLPELIRLVEDGEDIVITRHGKPVARITPAPPKRRQIRLGGMKDRIRLRPGWDAPVDPDRFLKGDL